MSQPPVPECVIAIIFIFTDDGSEHNLLVSQSDKAVVWKPTLRESLRRDERIHDGVHCCELLLTFGDDRIGDQETLASYGAETGATIFVRVDRDAIAARKDCDVCMQGRHLRGLFNLDPHSTARCQDSALKEPLSSEFSCELIAGQPGNRGHRDGSAEDAQFANPMYGYCNPGGEDPAVYVCDEAGQGYVRRVDLRDGSVTSVNQEALSVPKAVLPVYADGDGGVPQSLIVSEAGHWPPGPGKSRIVLLDHHAGNVSGQVPSPVHYPTRLGFGRANTYWVTGDGKIAKIQVDGTTISVVSAPREVLLPDGAGTICWLEHRHFLWGMSTDQRRLARIPLTEGHITGDTQAEEVGPGFNSVYCVDLFDEDTLVITDRGTRDAGSNTSSANGRILLFDLKTFQTKAISGRNSWWQSSTSTLRDPKGIIAVGDGRRIVIPDYGNHCIKMLEGRGS